MLDRTIQRVRLSNFKYPINLRCGKVEAFS
jgi:hypothetical protein